VHRNAPLTPEGRLRLCRLIEDGWTVASAAESMRISRQTAHKWWGRYQQGGDLALQDRSSRPRRCPTKTPVKVERRVVELRRRHQVSAARLSGRAGLPASTLHAIWARHGVSRLSDLERRSGRVVRRIETTRPGELVHLDVKKLGRTDSSRLHAIDDDEWTAGRKDNLKIAGCTVYRARRSPSISSRDGVTPTIASLRVLLRDAYLRAKWVMRCDGRYNSFER
jgi:hypothetical protein